MSEGDAVLIAAQSGRALAQAARRAGLRPFVLDLFGDEDTLALAQAHRPLPGRFGEGTRGVPTVLSGLAELSALAGGRPLGVILGSGFEGAPELIARIAESHRLIGAGAGTVAALKDPRAFALLCAKLSIPHPRIVTKDPISTPNPHPEVPTSAGLEGGLQEPSRELEPSFEARLRLAPQDEGECGKNDGWLLKRIGGSGGSHIRTTKISFPPPGHYLQARVRGRPFSLNVLADGRCIAVLAVTEQWTNPSPLRPFRYAGAIAPGRGEAPGLSESVRESATEAVARLVTATGLRGLASADILVDGSDWWLLEINPRPGATLDVLDRRATPLLSSHVEASLGRLPRLDPAPDDAAGSEICYAAKRYPCMGALDWPDFARDRPRPGALVARDAPLCTIAATGSTTRAVTDSLRERARAISVLLEDREDFHDDRYQEPERQRPGVAAG